MWPEAILRLWAVQCGETSESFFKGVIHSKLRLNKITLDSLLEINSKRVNLEKKKSVKRSLH